MNRRVPKPKRLGSCITDALSEVLEAVRSDRPLRERLTVRTIEVCAPRTYSPKAVRKTRDRLAVSQAVFARLMGVSVELIEHWEQGIASPRPLARRLLDEINRDPRAFISRYIAAPDSPKRAAG
jgi:putative transcriptional regulator